MKIWKTIAMLAGVAFTLTSCLTGIGHDEVIEAEKRLTLNPSTTVIYANGTDEVIFAPKYGSMPLGEEDITLYNGDTNEEIELPGFKFTTTAPNNYTFYATYQTEEELMRSETVTIQAIEESVIDVSPTDDEGLTISLSSTVFQADNGFAAIVARYNGEVLNASQLTIYDAESIQPVEFETMEVEGYTLPVFRSSEDGTFRFIVEYKIYQSEVVAITVVDFPIPPRMVDPHPEKLNFWRKVLITDFTGTGCQYCPYMLAAMEDVAHDELYGDLLVLTAAHTYGGDPIGAPINGAGIDAAMGVTTYPTVVFDLATYITNVTYEKNVENLKLVIDERISKNPAKAGIAASISANEEVVVIRMTIKAAETGKYRVGAWLLEDGLEYAQINHGMPEEGYNFNIHNHAIRYTESRFEKSNDFTGHAVNNGADVVAGSEVDYLFQIPLSPNWKLENCYVCLFVSTPTASGGYSVNNVVVSNSLTESISYRYTD